ncbi:Uncharacterized protein conserved in bacteria [Legionella steigerwaltii]|uniref:Uncharacterized protein conserved in bacteria n=1 Tax=Legionella steigerwaltii TaxID=460 RepID=A0A378LAW5_9GAMM|nr:DUF1868 domain-containing protein [Legionella steigerwaltii]KTD77752.1 hypothetical protein Lstg_2109 [Legionella steigerwaltii]STY23062.1 Uncharacterized protein conserved in bacteria [Legionella steigerwaltii]
MFTIKNKQEHRQLSKVDEHGEYAPFPGVTVVSACYPEQKEFCDAIYKALKNNPLIMHYFSPLPANSYHMTTMSLETEQQVGSTWDQFITNNLPHYKKIKQNLQKKPIYPAIEKLEIYTGWCISLNIFLPKEHAAQIEEMAEALNIEETIPRIFHITLAYPRPNKTVSQEIKEQLHTEIIRELNGVIEKTIFPLKIAEAKLCYFHDMTAFHPWNAENNPFTQSKHLLDFMQANQKSAEDFQEKYLHESTLST